MSTLRVARGVNRGYTEVPIPSFPRKCRINILRQELLKLLADGCVPQARPFEVE